MSEVRKYVVKTTPAPCRFLTEVWRKPDESGEGGEHYVRYCILQEGHEGDHEYGPAFEMNYTTMSVHKLTP